MIIDKKYYFVLGFGCALFGIIIQNPIVKWEFGFFLTMIGLFCIVMGELITIENELKIFKR